MFEEFRGRVRKQKNELSALKKIVTLALRKKVGDEFLPMQMPQSTSSGKQLREDEILATVYKNVSIQESVWIDMRNSVMDGEWHAFSEADEIIVMHNRDRQLSVSMILRIRQGYFKFARDEEYCAARGRKGYFLQRKRQGGVNKFRFTTVGEEAKPEKKVEKKDVLLEVRERPLRGEGILATVGGDSIQDDIWNDMQDSLMDGEWHVYSEANEFIRNHGYRHLSMERIVQIRQAYFKFAKDDEYRAVRGGIDYILEQRGAELIDGMKKFRFISPLSRLRIDYRPHDILGRPPNEKR